MGLKYNCTLCIYVAEAEKVRLVEGTPGLIEVLHNEEWRGVCDDYWDDADADVACRQLGFLGFGEYS